MCLSSDRSATSRLSRAILVLERPQLRELADAHVRVFLLPDVERGFAHAQLTADVGRRGAAFDLAEGVRALLSLNFDLFMVLAPW